MKKWNKEWKCVTPLTFCHKLKQGKGVKIIGGGGSHKIQKHWSRRGLFTSGSLYFSDVCFSRNILKISEHGCGSVHILAFSSLWCRFNKEFVLKILIDATRYSLRKNPNRMGVFLWDFILRELQYFQFRGWSVCYNCLHGIPRNETHCGCLLIAVILTE